MKQLFTLGILLLVCAGTMAQNVQLHYDMGETRKMVTTTVEMFRPDDFGSTFFFIDMDYGSKASGVDGINLAYWEIARSFSPFTNKAIEPRIEYNGGFGRFAYANEDGSSAQGAYSINSAWLCGAQYTWHTDDFSKVLTLQGNYKYIKDKTDKSFQITAVWNLNFFNRKFTAMGFADFWKEGNEFFQPDGAVEKTDFVFLTEPQFWYNAGAHFSIGSEIEISSNFGGNEGFMVNPTVAGKWTF